MPDELDSLRQLAEQGDAEACIRLGDLLLEKAPYDSPSWEDDLPLRERISGLAFADIRANDAFECIGHSQQGEEGYLSWERSVRRHQFDVAARKEELGRHTPGRQECLRESVHWYSRAAELGDPAAMYRLGWRYRLGQGVEVDHDQADFWWHRAAEHGDDGGLELSGC